MSLDFDLELKQTRIETVFSANITHNLTKMAEACGVYEALWNPESIGAKYAKDIVPILEAGLKKLKSNPKRFIKYNSPNGWGTYKYFVPFVESVLEGCKKFKNAKIRVSI